MRVFLLLGVCLWGIACQRSKVPVHRIGELETLIKKADMKTHARLADYRNIEGLYAIGSKTNLDGFIQVIDGQAYNSRVVDDSVVIDTFFTHEATVFLYTQVAQWQEIDIPADVVSWKQLERFVGEQAAKFGLNKRHPFPFLLSGKVASAQWHVVAWDTADKKISFQKTQEKGVRGTLQHAKIKAIGFYSRKGYEVLTHRSQSMHIHFVNDEKTLAGHVDELTLDGHMKLLLPSLAR